MTRKTMKDCRCLLYTSAIKYATVKPIRDEDGYIYDYETIGEYPRWGEDDPRSNELAEWLIEACLLYTSRCLTVTLVSTSSQSQN